MNQTSDKSSNYFPENTHFQSALTAALNFYRGHFQEIWAAVLLLLGFILGRFLQKAHPIETYLQKFSTTTKSEAQLKASVLKARKIRRTLKALLIIAELFFFGLIAFFVYNENKKASFWATRDLKKAFQSAQQGHALLILAVILSAHFLFGYYFRSLESRLLFKLDNISSNKRIYMEKLLSLFGKEVVAEMQLFLSPPKQAEGDRSHSQGKTPRQSSASEREQLEALQLSMGKTKAKLAVKEKILKINEDFINSIIAFEWCANCYNEKEIEEFTRKKKEAKEPAEVSDKTSSNLEKTVKKSLEGQKGETQEQGVSKADKSIPMPEQTNQVKVPLSNEGEKGLQERSEGTQGGRCQFNCLVRFHVLCDELGKEMQEALGALRNKSPLEKSSG